MCMLNQTEGWHRVGMHKKEDREKVNMQGLMIWENIWRRSMWDLWNVNAALTSDFRYYLKNRLSYLYLVMCVTWLHASLCRR